MGIRVIVTGAAGFVGSHLVDLLLKNRCEEVIGIDNLRTGNMNNLSLASDYENFRFLEADIRDIRNVDPELFDGFDAIFHLAANADIRGGIDDTAIDFNLNVMATLDVCRFAVEAGIPNILFASTGSVYGDPIVFPTPEGLASEANQTSMYSASKLSAEAMLSAFHYSFGLNVAKCRMSSILGTRYAHGHVWDFTSSLLRNPDYLKVLGNGQQLKSYLNVADCVSAFWLLFNCMRDGIVSHEVFNLAHHDAVTVLQSLHWICEEHDVNPRIDVGDEPRGWIGDNPRIELDIEKLKGLGWSPKISLETSIKQTARDIRERIERPE